MTQPEGPKSIQETKHQKGYIAKLQGETTLNNRMRLPGGEKSSKKCPGGGG
jgi:hypothetical protein